jgi:hypothetical protein
MDDRRVRVRFQAAERDLSLLHPASYAVGTEGYFAGEKAAEE